MKQIEILEQTSGNDQRIHLIGKELLGLINERKYTEDKTSWREEMKAPRNLNLTVEGYIQFVREGLLDSEILERLGTSRATLQRWQVTNNINKRELKKKIRKGEL
ncbi:TPA: hypothetical protein NJY08_004389 [Salmonella enterica subsp. enterica serovar Typhi str. AG3]|nr:hypothetical protein [Salmonella enterica subsp. enterica serovar Typhi str. AG3]